MTLITDAKGIHAMQPGRTSVGLSRYRAPSLARATALAAGAKVGTLGIILALDIAVVEAGIEGGPGPGVAARECYDGEATS